MKKKMKIVIIGASGVLGNAICVKLAKENYTVFGLVRKNKSLKNNNKIKFIELDFKNIDEIKTVLKSIGKFDVLLNAIGIGIFKPFCEIQHSEWIDLIDANISIPFRLIKESIKNFKLNKSGRVINIGSIVDVYPASYNSAYAASKGALKSMGKSLNEEFKKNLISFTHISLGAVWSNIWENRSGFKKSDMIEVNDFLRLIIFIIETSPNTRIDEIQLFPIKGLL